MLTIDKINKLDEQNNKMLEALKIIFELSKDAKLTHIESYYYGTKLIKINEICKNILKEVK